MDLSLRLLADAANAQGAFKDFGSAATAAGQVIASFAKDCVKAFGEAERVSRQLARAAGDNAAAFEAQADAMSKQFAINDESIKQLQTLALTYGTLPQHVGGAVEAVENWSAVTGKDARSAMLELIKAVEKGTGTLDRGRISFVATGDSARDMANAIEALNKKFGGGAAADADTLEGRARGAANAFNELEETFGGFIGAIERKTGALSFLTARLREMQELLTNKDLQVWLTGKLLGDSDEEIAKHMSFANAPEVKPGAAGPTQLNLPDLPVNVKAVNPLDAIREGQADDERLARQAEFNHKWIKQEEEFELDQGKLYEKQQEGINKNISESNDLMMKAFEKQEDEHTKDLQKLGELQLDVLKDQTKQQEQELDKRMGRWLSFGERIGTALINGITSAIESQTKHDKDKLAKTLVQSIMAIVSIINPFVGAFLKGGAKVGQTIEAAGSYSGSSSTSLGDWGFHDGGWVPRFHDGGGFLADDERPAILQTGERVLSRRQVERMGGKQSVDAMANGGSGAGRGGGGGGHTFNVYAFDAQSLLEKFGGGSAERAIINAVRTNSGSMRTLLGAG